MFETKDKQMIVSYSIGDNINHICIGRLRYI